jgi:saccharopine dehydrogenase (NAD+, L-lysine-forming)
LFRDSQVCTEIVIGDINIEQANRLVAELDSPKFSAVKVDAFDHDGMVATMKEADIVYNVSGPYHLLGPKVLAAAIEAGRHYVDYCDDYDATIEMLDLDGKAKDAGITAILGLGASPGYFNLVAKYGVDKLDSTDEINMYWTIGKGEPEGPAVVDHMFHIMDGKVPQFLDGELVYVDAMSGGEEIVEMPAPYGKMPAVYVGHPEPTTLGRFIPGLKKCVNKFALPQEELEMFQGLQQLGLMNKEPVDVKGQQVAPRDLMVTLMMSAMAAEEVENPDDWPSIGVLDVVGTQGGQAKTLRYTVSGDMAPMTSIPGALGVEMLARGEITARGVLPPEACVEPFPIIDALEKLGLVTLKEEELT